jgi:transcriptional regulator
MLSESYDSTDRDTVVTEELIKKITALKGSKVTQEELNKLLGTVTDKARAIRKSAVSVFAQWVGKKRKGNQICAWISLTFGLSREDDDDDRKNR